MYLYLLSTTHNTASAALGLDGVVCQKKKTKKSWTNQVSSQQLDRLFRAPTTHNCGVCFCSVASLGYSFMHSLTRSLIYTDVQSLTHHSVFREPPTTVDVCASLRIVYPRREDAEVTIVVVIGMVTLRATKGSC